MEVSGSFTLMRTVLELSASPERKVVLGRLLLQRALEQELGEKKKENKTYLAQGLWTMLREVKRCIMFEFLLLSCFVGERE